jgi:hypothetical protein
MRTNYSLKQLKEQAFQEYIIDFNNGSNAEITEIYLEKKNFIHFKLFQEMNVLFNCAILHSAKIAKHSCAEATTASACSISRICKIWPRLQVEKFHDILKFGALLFA